MRCFGRGARALALVGGAIGLSAAALAAEPGKTGGSGVQLDFELGLVNLALCSLALVLYGLRVRQRARGQALGRPLGAGLVVLAVVSYASYYYFFQFRHPGGFDAEDVYLYYTGSKYSAELGYFGLYECTFAALVESGAAKVGDVERVRDLRTLRFIEPRRALVRGKRCKERFAPERWEAFRSDVTWFRKRMRPKDFAHVMADHGYHPGPVWTAVARPFVNAAPTALGGPITLSRTDRVLVPMAFLVVGWAFGLEAACFVAIAWGTGFLWRYGWIGDNFLRQGWMAALLIGLSLHRKGFAAGSGALLSLSALLRVFPAVFPFAGLLHAVRRTWDTRRLPPEGVRFVVGAALATLLLIGVSIAVAGRGPGIYLEFFEKMSHFEASPALNRVGVPVLVEAAAAALGDESVVPGRPATGLTAVASRVLTLGLGGLLLALLWRALGRVPPWAGAALGFTLIPVLTQPTNYYFTFVLVAVLLGTRAPRVGFATFLAAVAWIAGGLVFYGDKAEFVCASAVALPLCFFVVWEMGRAGPEPEASTLPPPEAATLPPSEAPA